MSDKTGMGGHRTNIEYYTHPWPHHRATCSCGWKGPNRTDRDKACQDEGRHRVDHAVDKITERAKRTGARR